MRMLLINPWAIINDKYYASGFIEGMNKFLKVDFVCNNYYDGVAANGKVYPYFFKHSEKMRRSLLRKVVRGLEYIIAWKKILKLVRNSEYDVIHFHWLLMYTIDYSFLNKIMKGKSERTKIVLTAHNVLPHINGEESVSILKKIYSCFDSILVHGESIRQEFIEYFPEFEDRVKIQYHGEYYQQCTSGLMMDEKEYLDLKKKFDNANRVYIMFGGHFYNKGTDRLVRLWHDKFSDSKSLLLILGRMDDGYKELKKVLSDLTGDDNIVFINRFVEDNLLNFCILQSDCIVLPYRHASMSGVVYTAAAFKKPLLCTKSGAIAEYLENGVDSILCEKDDESLLVALLELERYEKTELKLMGEKLANNIHEKYSWEKIAKNIVEVIYRDGDLKDERNICYNSNIQ